MNPKSPPHKLIYMLEQLQQVMLAVRNSSEGLLPERHHANLGPAVHESYMAIEIAKKELQAFHEKHFLSEQEFKEKHKRDRQITDDFTSKQEKELKNAWSEYQSEHYSEAKQEERRKYFEAGLLTPESLNFKNGIIQHAYEDMQEIMEIPKAEEGLSEESKGYWNEYKGEAFGDHPVPEPPQKQPRIKRILDWFREGEESLKAMKNIHKKVKTYVGAVRTVVKSIAKAHPILEIVNEALSMMTSGFDMYEHSLEILNKEKNQPKKEAENKEGETEG